MPYTHRPAACSAGTSAEKLEATVENVPCSSTTGRASEVQSGSFTPARPTGRRLGPSDSEVAGATGSAGTVDGAGLVGRPDDPTDGDGDEVGRADCAVVVVA